MSYKNSHPEQDPAEGSREVIDHELAHQQELADKNSPKTVSQKQPPKAGQRKHRPM